MVCTFIASGLIHDGVTVMIRGETFFLFSIWFMLMGLAVVGSKLFGQDHSQSAWGIRVLINVSIVGLCYVGGIGVQRFLFG